MSRLASADEGAASEASTGMSGEAAVSVAQPASAGMADSAPAAAPSGSEATHQEGGVCGTTVAAQPATNKAHADDREQTKPPHDVRRLRANGAWIRYWRSRNCLY